MKIKFDVFYGSQVSENYELDTENLPTSIGKGVVGLKNIEIVQPQDSADKLEDLKNKLASGEKFEEIEEDSFNG